MTIIADSQTAREAGRFSVDIEIFKIVVAGEKRDIGSLLDEEARGSDDDDEDDLSYTSPAFWLIVAEVALIIALIAIPTALWIRGRKQRRRPPPRW